MKNSLFQVVESFLRSFFLSRQKSRNRINVISSPSSSSQRRLVYRIEALDGPSEEKKLHG